MINAHLKFLFEKPKESVMALPILQVVVIHKRGIKYNSV